MKCSQSNSNVMCLEKCNIILDCGHQCTGNCGEPCPDCMTKVEIKGSCGHRQQVSCKKSKGIRILNATLLLLNMLS